MDSRLLKEEGMFRDGWRVGIWMFYNIDGQLEKEINYDNNSKTLYGKSNEPYDDVFNLIKNKSDSLLIERYGEFFFSNNVFQNTNRSYYYGAGAPGSWFEVPDYRPNEFLMRYSIKLEEKKHPFFEFTLDSLGSLIDKRTLLVFSNLKDQYFLSLTSIDSIALKNGLTSNAKPFQYMFAYSSDSLLNDTRKLELHVIGVPFDKKIEGNKEIAFFIYIVIDPWTGEFIRKEEDKIVTIID